MLELKNISYEIDGNLILNNINLSLDLSKRYILIGPNGSGKSTLLRLIMGLLKPTGGEIYLNGVNITNTLVEERSKYFVYSYQTPVTFKSLKVKDILRLSKIDIDNTLLSLLTDLNLSNAILDRYYDKSLSGGELKKIELIPLLYYSKFNLIDEPEAGVDIISWPKINNLLQNKQGIIVSHSVNIIQDFNVILNMKDGKIE